MQCESARVPWHGPSDLSSDPAACMPDHMCAHVSMYDLWHSLRHDSRAIYRFIQGDSRSNQDHGGIHSNFSSFICEARTASCSAVICIILSLARARSTPKSCSSFRRSAGSVTFVSSISRSVSLLCSLSKTNSRSSFCRLLNSSTRCCASSFVRFS